MPSSQIQHHEFHVIGKNEPCKNKQFFKSQMNLIKSCIYKFLISRKKPVILLFSLDVIFDVKYYFQYCLFFSPDSLLMSIVICNTCILTIKNETISGSRPLHPLFLQSLKKYSHLPTLTIVQNLIIFSAAIFQQFNF
jgi:hypothetical protein